MSSIVLIADLHLKSKDPYGVPVEGKPLDSRTQKRFQLLDAAVDFAIDNRVSDFISLGDLFHSRSVSEVVRVELVKRLRRLLDDEIYVYLVPGNHELHQGSVLLQSEQEFIATDTFSVLSADASDGNILFVPDIGRHRVEEFLSGISQQEKRNSILFGHFPVAGAWVSDKEVSRRGVDPKLLEGYPIAMLGDFHKRQLFDGSVTQGNSGTDYLRGYVGSLARNSFAEEGQQKGFIHLVVESRENGTFDFEAKVYPVDDTPFITYDVTEGTTFDLFKTGLPDVAKAVVRVRFLGTDRWFADFPVSEALDYCYLQGAEVVKSQPILVSDEQVDVGDVVVPDLDKFDLVKKNAKDDGLNLDAGMGYMRDAVVKLKDS